MFFRFGVFYVSPLTFTFRPPFAFRPPFVPPYVSLFLSLSPSLSLSLCFTSWYVSLGDSTVAERRLSTLCNHPVATLRRSRPATRLIPRPAQAQVRENLRMC